jgi:DNA-binding NarL/FixJ family response regulator
MTTRVLLADDHDMVREALRRVIDGRSDMRVVAEAREGREAVALAKEHTPDVAVVDLWMPGLSGEEAIRQIVESGSPTKVLALSMHDDWLRVRAALQAGALGYVVKSAAFHELIDAIHALTAGHGYLSPAVAHHVVDAVGHGEQQRSPSAPRQPDAQARRPQDLVVGPHRDPRRPGGAVAREREAARAQARSG